MFRTLAPDAGLIPACLQFAEDYVRRLRHFPEGMDEFRHARLIDQFKLVPERPEVVVAKLANLRLEKARVQGIEGVLNRGPEVDLILGKLLSLICDLQSYVAGVLQG